MSDIVSQRYRNFVAGVSQQPYILRHPEQLEEQLNGYSTEAGGLQKRPPTLFVNRLDGFPDGWPLVHFIDRDDKERYIAAFGANGSLKIYEAYTGNPMTVKVTHGDYLKCSDPLTELKMVTIADYTFVVNRKVTVRMATQKAPSWDNQGALINVKSGQYGRNYRIVINGQQLATYETPDGSKAEHVKNINTDYIADRLAEGCRKSGWNVDRGSSWLYITKGGTKVNKVECFDGYNNLAMFGIIRQVQAFTKLPSSAPNGFMCEVLGEKNTMSDDYYVRYDAEKGLWVECVKPNSIVSVDAATMPHVLIREADGSFSFKPAEWTKKETGDDLSNPLPSFVDETINDVFFYRNRLGFLSSENVILSNSSDFFNFWMASATAVRDTDPIDLAVSDNKIAMLYQAVPYGDELMVFSKDAQFSLKADGVLTPTNAKVNPMTYFSSNPKVQPVGVGRNIYFTAERSTYTSVKEFFTAFDDTDKKDAQDITSHIPSYIPNGVYKLIPSTIDNIILVLDKATPDTIFVYKFLFLDGVKQQSAWSKWSFEGSKVLGGTFMDSTLYLVMQRGTEVVLESLKLAYNTKDYTEEPYRLYLDGKTAVTPTDYDAYHDRTLVDLKALYKTSFVLNSYVAITPLGEALEGAVNEAGKLVIKGDHRGHKLFIGRPYMFRMTMSTPMLKQVTEGSTTTTTDGRLQIQRMWWHYADTGYFKVRLEVPSKHITREAVRSLYNLDNGQKMDKVVLLDGTFEVPIQALNTKIKVSLESAYPTPLAIVGGGYQARYTRKSRIVE